MRHWTVTLTGVKYPTMTLVYVRDKYNASNTQVRLENQDTIVLEAKSRTYNEKTDGEFFDDIIRRGYADRRQVQRIIDPKVYYYYFSKGEVFENLNREDFSIYGNVDVKILPEAGKAIVEALQDGLIRGSFEVQGLTAYYDDNDEEWMITNTGYRASTPGHLFILMMDPDVRKDAGYPPITMSIFEDGKFYYSNDPSTHNG